MTALLPRYQVELIACDPGALEYQWRELESRADPTFFNSWLWIGSWLRSIQPDAKVARIAFNDEVVGLGLLCCRREVRHKLLTSRVLRLTRTGDSRDDQIWIEYNGLLLDRQHQQLAPSALMEHLLALDDWDEFELGATDAQSIKLYQPPECSTLIRWTSPAFGIDLHALRNQGSCYLDSLSRNTRYQINRSRKRYEALGALTFSVQSDADKLRELWPELAKLHLAKWDNTTEGSGFSNPRFVDFHTTLINQHASHGAVEMCTLMLDGKLIGCLYNFLYRGRVYFYLSGIRQEPDSQLKPGLLLHSLAVQNYLNRQLDYYDFMGGDARYKQSLGQQHCELVLVSFQRPRFALKLEQLARNVKNRVRQEP